MPIFEYECNKCGHRTELLEKRASSSKHVCRKCGSSDMKRLLSGFFVGRGNPGADACPTGTCGLS